MVRHAEVKILWCWITDLSKRFCCVTRINQLCVPVGECWDPGLKIVSFPLWDRRQSPLSHGQDSHTSCRVAAHQPHLTAAHKKKQASAQNNSEFSSSTGSELVAGEELWCLRLLPQEHITILHQYSCEMTHTFSCMSSDADTLNQFDINEFSKQGWLTSPSSQWTSPATRAAVLFPPPHYSEVGDDRYLPRYTCCCYYCKTLQSAVTWQR